MKADVVKGEIKCPRCGAINKLNFRQGQEPIGCTKESQRVPTLRFKVGEIYECYKRRRDWP